MLGDDIIKVLIACAFSGIVRDAFLLNGHDALSCDLLPSERPGPHYMGDVRDILNDNWDLMIAHPPCTHLAVSGARWFKDKIVEQQHALDFVKVLMNTNIDKICIENPVSIISSHIRKPDQTIQPWMFGHPETKKTCLWLRGLNKLIPTDIVEPKYIITKDGKRYSPTHYNNGWSKNRGHERSRTYTGIANAMAEQWG